MKASPWNSDFIAVIVLSCRIRDCIYYADPLKLCYSIGEVDCSAIESRDLGKAFEATHALRGILGNMGLTQLHDQIAEITEKLRELKDIDYSCCIDTFF